MEANESKYITIKEAARLVKVNIATIYKNIKRGKIHSKSKQIRGKEVKYVIISDIESFFNISGKSEQIRANESELGQTKANQGERWQMHVKADKSGILEEQDEIYLEQIQANESKRGRTRANEGERGQTKANTNKSPLLQEQDEIYLEQIQANEDESGRTRANEGKSEQIKVNLKENIREVIEEYFESKQTQLMKPIEEQSIFIAGKLSQENIFLKQKIETLLQELELYKALPGPPDSINKILVENDQNLTLVKKEKEELQSRMLQEKAELEARLKAEVEEKSIIKTEAEEALKKLTSLPAPVESIHQLLLDNANNLKELVTEKTKIETQLKEQNSTIKEKEHALKENFEIHRQEIEKLKLQAEEEKSMLIAQVEEEKKQIAEAWKKELDLAKKPWWKFW
jgi:hypothetical protein